VTDASIVENINISVCTLSRCLSGEGTSLYFLIDEVRIERAVILLVSSTLPLATIARRGLQRSDHFRARLHAYPWRII
jgi:AraC-like DNA-binding protein